MDAKTTEPFVEGQEITYGLRAPRHPHLTVLRKRKGTQRVINVLPQRPMTTEPQDQWQKVPPRVQKDSHPVAEPSPQALESDQRKLMGPQRGL